MMTFQACCLQQLQRLLAAHREGQELVGWQHLGLLQALGGWALTAAITRLQWVVWTRTCRHQERGVCCRCPD